MSVTRAYDRTPHTMKSSGIWTVALLLAAASSTTAFAQNGSLTFSEKCYRGYRQNVQWPCPYIQPARRSIHSAFDMVINNGWRRQNLLGDYHFSKETNQLTEAGRLKVHWILTQTPTHRRNVYVQRGTDEAQTAMRVASVHTMTAGIHPSTGPASVLDTHIVAEGHPAGSVDATFVGYAANKPVPVLPKASPGGGSGQ